MFTKKSLISRALYGRRKPDLLGGITLDCYSSGYGVPTLSGNDGADIVRVVYVTGWNLTNSNLVDFYGYHTLYWKLTSSGTTRTITLYTDSARTIAVATGSATIANGATTNNNIYVNHASSGIIGHFTLNAPTDNLQDDDAGNILKYQYQNVFAFSNPTEYATSIAIERKSSTEAVYSDIVTLPINTTEYIDTIVDDPGKTYFYRVIVQTPTESYVTNTHAQVPYAYSQKAIGATNGTLDADGNIYIYMDTSSAIPPNTNGIYKSTDGGRTFSALKLGGGPMTIQFAPSGTEIHTTWASWASSKNKVSKMASPWSAWTNLKDSLGADLLLRNAWESGTASAGGNSTLTDASKNYTVNALANKTLKILTGDGAGESLTIASNTATVITVTGTWTQNPSSGSTYEVKGNDSQWYPVWGVDWDDDGCMWIGVTTQLNHSTYDATNANNYVYKSDATGDNFTEMANFPTIDGVPNYDRHVHTLKFNSVSKKIFVTTGDWRKAGYSMDKDGTNITKLDDLTAGCTGWSQVADGILWGNDDATGAHIVKTDHYGLNPVVIFELPVIHTKYQCWGIHRFSDGEIWSNWINTSLGRVIYVSVDDGVTWRLYSTMTDGVMDESATPSFVNGVLTGDYVAVIPYQNRALLFFNKIL